MLYGSKTSHHTRLLLPDPISIHPENAATAADIEALPSTPGVYAIHMPGAPPHLSSCHFLRARIRRLLGISAESGKQRLRAPVERIDCWPSASRLETAILLLGLAQSYFPSDYDRRLRLRRPWLVSFSRDCFQRLVVTQHFPESDGLDAWGPFPSRDAAAAYIEATAGLFQIRKCIEPFTPSPDHPGCIYGEMNQCLRPCQCAVSDNEYASELQRTREFLLTNGGSLKTSLLMAREHASEALDFELASHLHKRIERVTAAASLREAPVEIISSFGGVAVTRAHTQDHVRLWPMQNAQWSEPVEFALVPAASEGRSMDARLRETLAQATFGAGAARGDRSADLAVLLRWFRSSYRDGEWIPAVPGKGVSYRKLVGAISRVVKI